jgi:hypothetical protein
MYLGIFIHCIYCIYCQLFIVGYLLMWVFVQILGGEPSHLSESAPHRTTAQQAHHTPHRFKPHNSSGYSPYFNIVIPLLLTTVGFKGIY